MEKVNGGSAKKKRKYWSEASELAWEVDGMELGSKALLEGSTAD